MSAGSKKIRFIHTSDWQLGMTRAFLSAEASARFAQARIDAIDTLGKLANEHGAAFIVVAGDVFESNQLSRQTLSRALDALAALPVPVFLLPGNHDPLDGSSIFATPEFRAAAAHVFVLRDMTPVAVPGVEGVDVVGAPWRTKHPSSDLCAELCANLAAPPNGVRVAVAHGQVDSLSPDLSRPEIIALADVHTALESGAFHYLALGDRHSVTEVGPTGRVWYSGAPVATDFTEVEPNKALLVDLGPGGGCTVQRLAVGAWSFMTDHRALNTIQDVQHFEQWLAEVPDKARCAIKVSFEGSVNLATAAALDAVMETNGVVFASLRRRERLMRLSIVPDDLDEDSVALSGYARAAWSELLAEANAGDEVARDALRLFYRLAH